MALDPSCRSTAVSAELVPLLLFSTNDYLGLSAHPAVKAAAAEAAAQVGCGPRSSALVAGFTSEHRQLELELSALKGTQDALLFPTGYAANMAVVAVLAAQPQVVVLSDELNHASIIDGARLAARAGGQVSLQVYRHNDMGHLESLLAAVPPGARCLVVTDSLFSMDGDFADLRGLAALKRRYGFLLAVDEAHATLVCGANGGGAAEWMGVGGDVDVHIGTLSKAVGAQGGFVACSSQVRALLLNRGRSVIYSTALPVPVVAAARAALRVSRSEPWRRQQVWRLTRLVSQRLGVPAASPIIPLVVGDESASLQLSRQLLARGFHVPAIRPPTVPAGTCRLRVSLSAAHTQAHVEALLDVLQEELAQLPGARLAVLPHLMKAQQQERPHHPLAASGSNQHPPQQQQPQQQVDVSIRSKL
ncbi:PLP-dependent transferase [Scenedesmus sp. NREL 46B-D3]|nr:PLP-dependent transferase [Scenedesmus sp. NREL 46B-D3]